MVEQLLQTIIHLAALTMLHTIPFFMLLCVVLERGSTPEAIKTDMAYIYMNAGLAAVGTLVVATVIVGIACLMKRTINARYKQTMFYKPSLFTLLDLFQ